MMDPVDLLRSWSVQIQPLSTFFVIAAMMSKTSSDTAWWQQSPRHLTVCLQQELSGGMLENSRLPQRDCNGFPAHLVASGITAWHECV